MMGTGEASGEKRALRSAEAAICNPLIDDVSMRGARGLLISITGGKDLTLYEVDEAATRIREEVDADANIIVGATFDESLDGIIRVSVVATGVDIATAGAARPPAGHQAIPTPPQARPAAPPAPAPQRVAMEAKSAEDHERRIAELALRLKADNARTVEATEAHGIAPQPAPQPTTLLPPQPRADLLGAAAVAAALTPSAAPKPTLFADPGRPAAPPAPAENSLPKVFIPPQPERPASRAPRMMPSFEDLPVPGQNEYRARRGEMPEPEHPEKRRLTLLQRLAAVGLGRRDDEPEAEQKEARHPEPARRQPAERAPMRPRPAEPRSGEQVSEFAKRGAPQGLDPHGRPAHVPHPSEDDQLDIPAFLRRQAT
jgi:cell division protein FtsZ